MMIPVGYMAKRVAARPDAFPVGTVTEIHSVSGCISRPFSDYIKYWAHNGYWFFDSPDRIRELGSREGMDLTGQTFFYYEVFEHEFDGSKWNELPTVGVCVSLPIQKTLLGFDVVTFSSRSSPEHSPLSC